jgi:hypothetical protein
MADDGIVKWKSGSAFSCVLCFVCLTAAAGGSQAAQSTDALARLATDLRRSLRENPASYQRILWQAYHCTQAGLVDRKWVSAAASLKAQGFQIIQVGGTSLEHNYTVSLPDLVYSAPTGRRHPLILLVSVSPDVSRTAQSCLRISMVRASLQLDIHAPLAALAARPAYPAGTVLAQFLRLPQTTRLAAKYPILESIELTYERLSFPLRADVPYGERYGASGFSLLADFVRGTPSHQYSTRISYEVESGLDPPESSDAGGARPANFSPADTIGPRNSWSKSGEGEGGRQFGGVLERAGLEPSPSTEPADLKVAYSVADLDALPWVLRSLKIVGSYLTNADLTHLRRFDRLTYLDLSECEGDPNHPFTESGLRNVIQLAALKHLELNGAIVTDRLVAQILRLRQLKELALKDSSITDQGVTMLRGLPRLVELDLSYSHRLTDRALGSLGRARTLRRLNLLSCGEFSNRGLAHLGKLANLEELTLGTTRRVNDRGFAFLPLLRRLRSLTLGNMPLGDGLLRQVSRVNSLRTVDLIQLGTATDAGIQQLKSLSHLDWLGIQFCPKVTPVGIARLRQALPGNFALD